jgi:hypothetical protein
VQEEIESHTIALVINTGKLTAHELKAAMTKALAQMEHESAVRTTNRARDQPRHGQQTVKQLLKQGDTVTHVEIPGQDARSFARIARKYDVDFSIEKLRSGSQVKYLAFFKAKDADALTAAFHAYVDQQQKKQEKPSLRKALSQNAPTIEPKEKEQEVSR